MFHELQFYQKTHFLCVACGPGQEEPICSLTSGTVPSISIQS